MIKSLITISMAMALAAACNREDKDPRCDERPPEDELCQAYFERWFYNAENGECEQIGYSGCNEAGFATQQACEDCVD